MDDPANEDPELPWYVDGLRFGCTCSGECCRNHGEYTYVYLEEVEVEALAAHLDLPVYEFYHRYCVEDDGWTTLRMDVPQCPFLDERGKCGVYEARPVQCRTWPFWEENLKSPNRWKRASEICPGVGRGRLYSAAEAEGIARATEDWYAGDQEGPVPTTDDGPARDDADVS